MTRLIAAPAAIAALMSLAPAAPVPKAGPNPVCYFPTTVGDVLVYRSQERDMTRVVTAVEAKGDARVVTLTERYPGGVELVCERVAASPAGLGLAQLATFPIDPPVFKLRLPARPGESWEYRYPGREKNRFGVKLVEEDSVVICVGITSSKH